MGSQPSTQFLGPGHLRLHSFPTKGETFRFRIMTFAGINVGDVSMKRYEEFQVIGETADFLAVDKPAGLLVHPSKPGGPRTLWDGLRDLLGYELATGGQISIINRLDRETSGLVIVAKNGSAARAAGLAMQRREVHKEYLAMVFGWPDWTESEVEAPILRLGEVAPSQVWLQRAVHPAGAEAKTEFQVLRRVEGARGRFALLRARPLTGRTHQIRVHLAHLGFPVLGDKIYARGEHHYLDFIERGWTEDLAEALWLPRHALHCTKMEIPFDGIAVRWTSPLPADLEKFLISRGSVSIRG
jgi:23S rRNA pseudouridine1911/1915/1917 synthase